MELFHQLFQNLFSEASCAQQAKLMAPLPLEMRIARGSWQAEIALMTAHRKLRPCSITESCSFVASRDWSLGNCDGHDF